MEYLMGSTNNMSIHGVDSVKIQQQRYSYGSPILKISVGDVLDINVFGIDARTPRIVFMNQWVDERLRQNDAQETSTAAS